MADESPEQLAILQELLARGNPAARQVAVQPMSGVGRAMSGGAKGTTNPLTGGVSVNMQAVESPQDLEDTLRHEFVHAGQIDKMSPLDKVGAFGTGFKQGIGMGVPYGQRPEEMEAYQVQNDARAAKGLSPTPTPTFNDPRSWLQRTLPEGLGGQPIPMLEHQDIRLPSTKLVEAQKRKMLEAELLRREAAKRGN